MSTRASFTAAILLLVSIPACSPGETGTSTAGGGPSSGPSVTPAATKLDTPLDAVPSPSADHIYFVAKGLEHSTLFSVALPSSDMPSALSAAPDGCHHFASRSTLPS